MVIVVNYMIVPVIYAALGETEWVTLKLPLEFWATWGTVSGAFVVGRTAEKMGKSNKTTSVLTGSKK